MAEFPVTKPIYDTGAEWRDGELVHDQEPGGIMDLFDDVQNYNLVRGLNRTADGFQQLWYEVGEALNIYPKGKTEQETERMKRDQQVLRDASGDAPKKFGAGATEFVGEALPLFAVPLGGTRLGAAALGAGASAGFFHEDPTNESRLADIGIGAGGGFLFRSLLDRFSGARGEANRHINALTVKANQGPSAPGPGAGANVFRQRPAFPPQTKLPPPNRADLGTATIVPDELSGPGVQGLLPAPPVRGLTGPQAPGRLGGPQSAGLLPRPAPRSHSPRASLADQGLGADDFQNAGRNIASRARGVRDPELDLTPGQRAIRNFKELPKVNPAKAAVHKRLAEYRMKMATKKLNGIAKSLANARSEKAIERLRKAETEAKAERVVANAISKLADEAVASKRASRASKGATPPMPKTKAALRKWLLKHYGEELNDVEKAHIAGTAPGGGATVRDMRSYAKALREKQKNKQGTGKAPGKQGGFVENDAINTAGFAAGGALLGAGVADENPLLGAAVGGLAFGAAGRALSRYLGRSDVQTKKTREAMRKASEEGTELDGKVTRAMKAKDFTMETLSDIVTNGPNVMDKFLGATITRLSALAPRMANELRRAEYRQHEISNRWITEGERAFEKIDNAKFTDAERRKFNIYMLNRTDFAKNYARRLGQEEAAKGVEELEATLAEAAEYLKGVGLGAGLRANYMPRMVTDVSYFENVKEVSSYLEQLMKKKNVDNLTDYEREIAITEAINGAMKRGNDNTSFGKVSDNLKMRTRKVDDKTYGAYADLRQGFNDYVESITNQVERRKFFQGQGVKVDDLGGGAENIDSIARRLAQQLNKGDLTQEQVNEITQLIRMRFGPGEQAPSRFVQNFKNLTYTGLLANPIAAITQFGDIALGAHRNGIRNTVAAIADQLGGEGKLRALDKQELLGIRNAASDFASRTATRDVLNWGLKYSGFQGVDRFGKNTFIQGAMLKNQQMDIDQFRSKWKDIFDPDAQGTATPRTDELYKKVQAFDGEINPTNREDLGFMLWNELEGVQPISLSSLPEKYLQHPDGRMFYMLQSFTLKLFDVMRKDIYNNLKNPATRREGIKNAVRLSSLFVLLNGGTDAAKDFILGKPQEAVMDRVVNNYLRMAGLNKFTVDQIQREGLGKGVMQTIAPPTTVLDAIGDPSKLLQSVPIGGRIIEERMGE